MKLSEHFQLDEFRCPCGCKLEQKPEIVAALKDLVVVLEDIRAEIGVPLVVHSGVRCPSWNRKCKGVPRSQHLLGKAADLVPKDKPVSELADLLRAKGVDLGVRGLGLYSRFVHTDIRSGRRATWRG
ncbi:MAG: DUF882 domain-containing protein [Deltaproteobacteria bacterium]|nr:DUF882 domain-containing protein [Deltaproteobacteria bacterium]